MKGSHRVLCALALVSVALATPEWDAARAAYAAALDSNGAEGVGHNPCDGETPLEPVAGKTYWFFELWPRRGAQTDCVSGYGHARLIVGSRTGTEGAPGDHFEATAIDLRFDPEVGPGEPVDGKKTRARDETFKIKPERTPANDFQWIGATDRTARDILREGRTYVREHPYYKTNPPDAANCRTFVEALTHRPVTDNPNPISNPSSNPSSNQGSPPPAGDPGPSNPGPGPGLVNAPPPGDDEMDLGSSSPGSVDMINPPRKRAPERVVARAGMPVRREIFVA